MEFWLDPASHIVNPYLVVTVESNLVPSTMAGPPRKAGASRNRRPRLSGDPVRSSAPGGVCGTWSLRFFPGGSVNDRLSTLKYTSLTPSLARVGSPAPRPVRALG